MAIPFSPQVLAAAREIFEGRDADHPPCPDCGGVHARVCPRVASEKIVMGPNNVIVEREVHYWPNGQWEENVIFADMAYEDEDS